MKKQTVASRDRYLRVGAEIDNPARVLVWREVFAKSTYRKWIAYRDGSFAEITAPVFLVLGDKWRFWQLDKHLFVGYQPTATDLNHYWQTSVRGVSAAVPAMMGDLVFFDWQQDVGRTLEQLVLHVRTLVYEKYVRSLLRG